MIKCSICRENNATEVIFLSTYKGKKRKRLNLCFDCWFRGITETTDNIGRIIKIFKYRGNIHKLIRKYDLRISRNKKE